MKNYSLLFGLLSILTLVSSCEDEKINVASGADYALVEMVQADVIRQVEGVLKESNYLRLSGFLCAETSVTPDDTINWPKQVMIDFGASNCLSADDNRFHRGVINSTLNKRLLDFDAVLTINPVGYFVSDVKVEGAFEVIYKGRDVSNKPLFDIKTSTGRITNSNGKIINWNCELVQNWIEGDATLTPFDDVYNVTGGGSGLNSEGVAYTYSTNSALVKDVGCAWTKKGSITVQIAGGGDVLLDFGAGGCDNKATISQGGTTQNITLL
jgi:hypothetical protein